MFAALWGGALLLAGASVFGLAAFAAGVFFAERIVSIAHSWSTTWMVLWSPLLAEQRRLRRMKFTWIPLAIALFALALGLFVAGWQRFPADGAFGPSLWAFGLYIALFWVLHFWHFGNQDFGVLSLYRLKACQTGERDRRIDRAFASAMMFVIQPIVYLKALSTVPLSEAFLEEIGRSFGRPPAGMTREAKEALLGYRWPGNVRELRNVLERAAIVCEGGLIAPEHLVLEKDDRAAASHTTNIKDVERELIRQVLRECNGNKAKAARRLGLTRKQLYGRLRQYGLGA